LALAAAVAYTESHGSQVANPEKKVIVKSPTAPPFIMAAILVLITVGTVLWAGAAWPDKAILVLAIPFGLMVVVGAWQAPAAATLVLVALIGFDSPVLLPEALRVVSPLKLLFPILFFVLLLGLAVGRFQAPPPHPLDWWIVGWTALNLMLWLVAQDKAAAFDFCRRWLSMVLLYWLITRIFVDNGKYERLLMVIVFSMAISCLIGLATSVAGTNPFSIHQDPTLVRITGATGMDPNTFAVTLLLPLFLAATAALTHRGAGFRRVYLAVASVLIAGIILTYSRSAFLVLVMMAAIAVVTWRRHITRAQWAIIGMGLMIVLVLQSEEIFERVTSLSQVFADEQEDFSLWRRQNYLRVGLNIFKNHPFLGAGPGNFAVLHAHPDYQPQSILVGVPRQPHNTYVQVISETGLVGLIFFIGAAVTALARTAPAMRTGAVYPQGLFIVLLGFGMMGLFLHLLLVKYVWITLALVRAIPEEGPWFVPKSSA
jgi:putative inorganic carbon (hco3(-)) transporter